MDKRYLWFKICGVQDQKPKTKSLLFAFLSSFLFLLCSSSESAKEGVQEPTWDFSLLWFVWGLLSSVLPSLFPLTFAFSTTSLPLSRDAPTPNFRGGGEKYRTKNRRMEETAFTCLHWQRVPFKIMSHKENLAKTKE